MAQELLYPDTELTSTNLSGSPSDLDAQDSNWYTSNTAGNNTVLRVGFPSPTNTLTGTQTFTIQARYDGGGKKDPQINVSLYYNGTEQVVLDSGTVISPGTGGATYSYTWNASDVPDGADVELYVEGVPQGGNSHSLEFGFAEWDCQFERSASVTTEAYSNVSYDSATLEGSAQYVGWDTAGEVWFEWRATGASTWNTTPRQTISQGGNFSDTISGLNSSYYYEFRAKLEDGSGTVYSGSTIQFETKVRVSGTITQDGSSVAGATVYIIRENDNVILSIETTDSNGYYETAVDASYGVHIAAEYEDGSGNYYAGPSLPNV